VLDGRAAFVVAAVNCSLGYHGSWKRESQTIERS
jgi:hypothetical protein